MISIIAGLVMMGAGIQATPPKVWAKLYIKQRPYNSGMPIKARIYFENASRQDLLFLKRWDPLWIAKDRFGNILGPHEVKNVIGDYASIPTRNDLVRIKAGERRFLGVRELEIKGRGVFRVRVVVRGGDWSKELGIPVWSGQAMSNEVRLELR